jgi:hypothetical protein
MKIISRTLNGNVGVPPTKCETLQRMCIANKIQEGEDWALRVLSPTHELLFVASL